MSIRPFPVRGGAARRFATDHDLLDLFAEMMSARAADRQAREQRRPDVPSRSDANRLTLSLGAYAKVSITQDIYMGRQSANPAAAQALEHAFDEPDLL